jgi:hypothetical protein
MKIGDKLNKLTLTKNTGIIKSGNKYYKTGIFNCECGNEKMIIVQNVEKNNTKSCGCNYKISNKDKQWGRK